jgi:hypothetical protein
VAGTMIGLVAPPGEFPPVGSDFRFKCPVFISLLNGGYWL